MKVSRTDSPVECTDVAHIFFNPGWERAFEECLLDMQVLLSKAKLQGVVSSEGGILSQTLNSTKAQLGGREGGTEGLRMEVKEDQGKIFKV